MSTNIIPELNWLLELVKREYGRDISTSTDFEALSVTIEHKIGELLSSSTLKSLFGQFQGRVPLISLQGT